MEVRGLGSWKRADVEKGSSPELGREHFLWRGEKKKKSDSGKKCETKEPFIYFPKKFHPKIDSSEFMKFAHGQPVNQK